MAYEIPSKAYIGLLDQVIDIHWDNHAMVMFGLWFVLVPAAMIAIRFGKPRPTIYGIPRGTRKLDRRLLWWTVHYYFLYATIILSICAGAFAVYLSGGFSATLHAYFGIGAILMGALQIVSAWFRGSHGGKQGEYSNPDDRSTWGGDHFDMSAQRRWFEAYHKTAGYFAITLAIGAVVSGLSQFWMPVLAAAFSVVIVVTMVLAVVMQGRGYHYDTYRSVYGNHPEHPFNKSRQDL
jgi:hypothetical protein